MPLNDAQLTEVEALKSLIGETKIEDDELYVIIQSNSSINAAAAEVWRRKAVEYTGLIDITEGSSTRKLGSLQTQAISMQKVFADLASAEVITEKSRPLSRAIVRP